MLCITFKKSIHNLALHGKYDGVVAKVNKDASKVNKLDKSKRTPLHCACSSSVGFDCAIFLLDCGADINAVDANGSTPLHLAGECGSLKICMMLMDRGAKFSALNFDGRTTLDIARKVSKEFSIRLAQNMQQRMKTQRNESRKNINAKPRSQRLKQIGCGLLSKVTAEGIPRRRYFEAVAMSGAPLHESADLSSKFLGWISYGEVVEVVEQFLNSDGIIRLQLSGGRGWTSLYTVEDVPVMVELERFETLSSSRSPKQAYLERAVLHPAVDDKIVTSPVSHSTLKLGAGEDNAYEHSAKRAPRCNPSNTHLLSPTVKGELEDSKSHESKLRWPFQASTAPSSSARYFKAVYTNGAPVRRGIELTSELVDVVPQGEVVQVVEQCINSQGVVRVRLAGGGGGWTSLRATDGEPVLEEVDEISGVDQLDPWRDTNWWNSCSPSSASSVPYVPSSTSIPTSRAAEATSYLPVLLQLSPKSPYPVQNPALSFESPSTRSPAAVVKASAISHQQLLAFDSVLRHYKVVYADGAPARIGKELNSEMTWLIPQGAIIAVCEVTINSQKIPRVRLADGSGWTSLISTDGVRVLEPVDAAVAMRIGVTDMKSSQPQSEVAGLADTEVVAAAAAQQPQPPQSPILESLATATSASAPAAAVNISSAPPVPIASFKPDGGVRATASIVEQGVLVRPKEVAPIAGNDGRHQTVSQSFSQQSMEIAAADIADAIREHHRAHAKPQRDWGVEPSTDGYAAGTSAAGNSPGGTRRSPERSPERSPDRTVSERKSLEAYGQLELLNRAMQLFSRLMLKLEAVQGKEKAATAFFETSVAVVPAAALETAQLIMSDIVSEIQFDTGEKNDFLEMSRTDPDKMKLLFQLTNLLQTYYNRCNELAQWLSRSRGWESSRGSFTSVDCGRSDVGMSSKSNSESESPRDSAEGAEMILGDNVETSDYSDSDRGVQLSGCRHFSLPPEFEVLNIAEKVRRSIADQMSMRIERCFHFYIMDSTEAGYSAVAGTLDAASYLIQLIVDLVSIVDDCAQNDYNVVHQYFEIFRTSLKLRFQKISDELVEVEVVDILTIIDWAEYFHEQLERFGFAGHPSNQWMDHFAEDMLSEYLHRIKAQALAWLDNMQRQPVEIIKKADKTLVTPNPEDMFRIINMQLTVAQEHLSVDYLKFVIIACLQILGIVQRRSYDMYSDTWNLPSPETICALVNDSQRMQKMSLEHLSAAVQRVPQESVRAQLQVMLEEVAGEFSSVASAFTEILARAVLADLEEPVFSALFGTEWAAGKQLAQVVTLTLEDYFADMTDWLCGQHFSLFVYHVLVQLVAMYCMSLNRAAAVTASFKLGSAARARVQINEDARELLSLFERFAEDVSIGRQLLSEKVLNVDDSFGRVATSTTAAGAATSVELKSGSTTSALKVSGKPSQAVDGDAEEGKSIIMAEFVILFYLASIMDFDSLDTVTIEVTALFERWGVDGKRLVQSVIQSNPALSAEDAAELAAELEDLFASGRTHDGSAYSSKPVEYFRADVEDTAAPSWGVTGFSAFGIVGM